MNLQHLGNLRLLFLRRFLKKNMLIAQEKSCLPRERGKPKLQASHHLIP
jgi:hypothetical protein